MDLIYFFLLFVFFQYKMVKLNKITSCLFLMLFQIHLYTSTEVIIIGAGASGLAAAINLNSQGINTKILEVRKLIGGRINTDFTSFGYPIDPGAILITQQADNPLLKFADKNNIRQVPMDFGNALFLDKKGKVLKNLWPLLLRIRGNLISFIKTNYEKYKNKSIQFVVDSFKKFSKLKFLEKIAVDYIAEFFNLSRKRPLYDLKKFFFKGAESFLAEVKMTPDGYISILKPEAEKLDIKFNTIINNISQEENKITVIDNEGLIYTADYVIITVALGYLKKNLIDFSPQLSAKKKEAIEQLAFFNMNKVFVEFEEKFWSDEDWISFFSYPLVLNFACNFHKVNGKNLLIFFIADDNYELNIRYKSIDQLKLILLEKLNVIFPDKNIKITNFLKTNWNDDPFTFGSFTEVAGHEYLRRRFMEPEGRLIFAGEHTAPKFNAFVYGAYLSGLRAAKQIIELSGHKISE